MEDFCKSLGARTGLTFMILAGGPDPRHGGELRTMGYHSTKNKHGITFGKAYPEYENAILKPFSSFLHQVYSKFFYLSRKNHILTNSKASDI